MHTMSDFYDKLDLKYPEIGIAMEDIIRSESSMVKFIIPVLTPNLDSTKLINQTIYQNKINLMNENKSKFEVDNIQLTNYVQIPVPVEVRGNYPYVGNDVIEKGSKWIIVFVGGDITKPRAIARYME